MKGTQWRPIGYRLLNAATISGLFLLLGGFIFGLVWLTLTWEFKAAGIGEAPPAASVSSVYGEKITRATNDLAKCYQYWGVRGLTYHCADELGAMRGVGQEVSLALAELPDSVARPDGVDRYRSVRSGVRDFLDASSGYAGESCGSGYLEGSQPCSGLYQQSAVAWTAWTIQLRTVEHE